MQGRKDVVKRRIYRLSHKLDLTTSESLGQLTTSPFHHSLAQRECGETRNRRGEGGEGMGDATKKDVLPCWWLPLAPESHPSIHGRVRSARGQ